MHPDNVLRTGCFRSNLGDRQRTRVGGKNGVFPCYLLYLPQNPALQIQILKHRLNHYIRLPERIVGIYWMNKASKPVGLKPAIDPALPGPLDIILHHLLAFECLLQIPILQPHMHTLLGGHFCDPGSHQPRTQNSNMLHGSCKGRLWVFLGSRHPEKKLNKRSGFGCFGQLSKQSGFVAKAFLEAMPQPILHTFDDFWGCRIISLRGGERLAKRLAKHDGSPGRRTFEQLFRKRTAVFALVVVLVIALVTTLVVALVTTPVVARTCTTGHLVNRPDPRILQPVRMHHFIRKPIPPRLPRIHFSPREHIR